MNKNLILFLLLFIVNKSILSQELTEMEELKNVFSSSVIAADVEDLRIEKENAQFILKKGRLFFGKEIKGNKYAAAFMGEGIFNFYPPDQIERDHLKRFIDKDRVEENFKTLFFFFADSSTNKIFENIEFLNDDSPGLEKSFTAVKHYLMEESNPRTSLLYTILEEEKNNGFFLAFIDPNVGNPLLFEINPYEEEEVSFSMKKSGLIFRKEFETISQYSSSSIMNSKNGFVKITNYKINSSIENNLDFSASTRVDFISKFDYQNWVLFYLYKDMEVDSILWNDKDKIRFYKDDEGSIVWIKAKETLKKNENYSVTFYYHGDLLEKNEFSWIQIKSPGVWFPRTMLRETANFDLTFHTPAKYKFCAIGTKISEEEEDDILTTVWKTEYPVRNASFNIGLFKEYELEVKDIPTVKVWMSESGHREIARALAPHGILSSGNMEEKIAADVVNSFNMFKTMFGEIPLKEIYVTETPYMHGEAYPGLVHLSWYTYQGIENSGEDEIFRAHEVAHQWWGIYVDFESYHDQWLSEGFSEYSGLWFLQALEGNNDKFFDRLDNWKDRIIDNRKYLFSSGQEAGPIYMGYRTHSSNTEGDYSLIIYKKGAWVIHMLRNMLLDLITMNEDRFKNMMKDFFETYGGKKASTEDFKKITDKHFGEDMSWFFNQWVYGTEIPSYKFNYSANQTNDGKYKVRCIINAENVSNNFKAYIPLLIIFDEDKYVRLRVEVKGNYSEFDLPLLPLKPEKIIFNDLNSVLCEID